MFCLHDSAPMYSYVKFNFKASLFFQLLDLSTPSGGEMHFSFSVSGGLSEIEETRNNHIID